MIYSCKSISIFSTSSIQTSIITKKIIEMESKIFLKSFCKRHVNKENSVKTIKVKKYL